MYFILHGYDVTEDMVGRRRIPHAVHPITSTLAHSSRRDVIRKFTVVPWFCEVAPPLPQIRGYEGFGEKFMKALERALGEEAIAIVLGGYEIDDVVVKLAGLIERGEALAVGLCAPDWRPPSSRLLTTGLLMVHRDVFELVSPDARYRTLVFLHDLCKQIVDRLEEEGMSDKYLVPINAFAEPLMEYKSPQTVGYALDVIHDVMLYRSKFGTSTSPTYPPIPDEWDMAILYAYRKTGDAYNESMIYALLDLMDVKSIFVHGFSQGIIPLLLYSIGKGASVWISGVADEIMDEMRRAGIDKYVKLGYPPKPVDAAVVKVWTMDDMALVEDVDDVASKYIVVVSETGEAGPERIMCYKHARYRRYRYYSTIWRKGLALLVK